MAKQKKNPNHSGRVLEMMDNLYGQNPEAARHFQAMIDAMPPEAPIYLSEDRLFMPSNTDPSAVDVPWGRIDFRKIPSQEVFLVWLKALETLRSHTGIRAYVQNLGMTQARIIDEGLMMPQLPDRTSLLENEEAIFSVFPEVAPLLDFVSSVPPEYWLGLHTGPEENSGFFLDPARVFALQERRFKFWMIDHPNMWPFVLIDMHGYVI